MSTGSGPAGCPATALQGPGCSGSLKQPWFLGRMHTHTHTRHPTPQTQRTSRTLAPGVTLWTFTSSTDTQCRDGERHAGLRSTPHQAALGPTPRQHETGKGLSLEVTDETWSFLESWEGTPSLTRLHRPDRLLLYFGIIADGTAVWHQQSHLHPTGGPSCSLASGHGQQPQPSQLSHSWLLYKPKRMFQPPQI